MRTLKYNFNIDLSPDIGDLVIYDDHDMGQLQLGLVVNFSIEEYEDEIIESLNSSIEFVMQEYICYTIINERGEIQVSDNDIKLFHRELFKDHQTLTSSKSNNS